VKYRSASCLAGLGNGTISPPKMSTAAGTGAGSSAGRTAAAACRQAQYGSRADEAVLVAHYNVSVDSSSSRL
jgi:hypothetical protein